MKVGRKPVLRGLGEVVWIGTECENMWREIAFKDAVERADTQARRRASQTAYGKEAIKNLNSDALTKLRGVQEELRAIPVLLVKRHGRSVEQRDPLKKGYSKELQQEAHRWQKAIRKKDPGNGFQNAVSERVTRPWGYRETILKKVSAKASRRYGRPITMRMVDKCWRQYRRLFLSL